jgi:uncharacterized protein (TIGR02594 family)
MNFYGDNFRWFIGSVAGTDDPITMGRVQVRIFGIHQDDFQQIPDDKLPFAQVLAPINSLGNPLGLKFGDRVFGIFLDGKNSQMPLVMGHLPHTEPFTSLAGNTSDSTLNYMATGSTTDPHSEFDAVDNNQEESRADEPENATIRNPQYPHNKVTSTTSGHVIEIDDTPEFERLHFYHKTGTNIEMQPNGDMVIHTRNDGSLYEAISGQQKSYVKGDKELFCEGDYTMTIFGNLNIQVQESVVINGKKIDLNSTAVTLKGRVHYDAPTPYDENVQPVNTEEFNDVPDAPDNPEQVEGPASEGGTYPELSPKTCGQIPTKNPYDIAKELHDLGGWKETTTNKNIESLWKEIGYEKSAKSFTRNRTAWCATFVGATLKRSGAKYIQTASSQAYNNYGESVDGIDNIKQGDIVVFHRNGVNSGKGHVGIATGRVKDGKIEIIGGNQGNNLTTKYYPISNPRKGWGLKSIRRAVSCSDGSTVPDAGTVAYQATGEGGSVV